MDTNRPLEPVETTNFTGAVKNAKTRGLDIKSCKKNGKFKNGNEKHL